MFLRDKKWQKFRSISRYLYTFVVLFFIISLAFQERSLLLEILSVADPVFLFCATVIWMISHLISPLAPLMILQLQGYSFSYTKSLHINVSRLPARYLPGGVWQTVGRFVDYHTYGVTKKHLSYLLLFETFFPVPVSFMLGTVLIWLGRQNSVPVYTLVSFLLIIFLTPCMCLYLPKYFIESLNISKRNFLYCVSIFCLSVSFWLIAATAFIFYLESAKIEEYEQISRISIAGSYILSWGVGYLAFFAPQGVGVFEVVAGKLMSLPIGYSSSIVFFAAFRLVILFADCLFYFLYFICRKFR